MNLITWRRVSKRGTSCCFTKFLLVYGNDEDVALTPFVPPFSFPILRHKHIFLFIPSTLWVSLHHHHHHPFHFKRTQQHNKKKSITMGDRSVWSIFVAEKPELKLALMDEIMFNNKRFQTKGEWEIEVAAKESRWNVYYSAFATYTASWVLTAPVGTVKRAFGPPDALVIPPWRMAKDAIMNTVLSLNGVRPQATGVYRQALLWGPSFAVLAGGLHYVESSRYAQYLALEGKTAFGDLAAAIDKGEAFEKELTGSLDQV